MTTKEIIAYILNREDVSSAAFAKNIGVHPTQVYDLQSGKTKKISSGVGNKIINRYPDYNLTWLLTGEGEMLKGDTTQDKPTSIEAQHKSYFKEERDIMVPLIHIDSVGGVHSQNLIESSEQYVEQWIPLPDARPGDLAIIQSGDSMTPTIPSGAVLQIRQVVDWQEYFGYGNVFVLWLSDDRRITKQVLKYIPDPKKYVTCHSFNPDAADEELPRSMIKQVWKVVNILINKGW